MSRTAALVWSLILMTGLVGGAAQVSAHHSFANFDLSRCSTIQGTVRKFAWSYPHSWLWVEVRNRDGGTDVWGFEGEPPSNLAQDGFKKTSIRKGDQVTVGFSPLRDGRKGGAYSAVKFPDGTVLKSALGKRPVCGI